MSRGLNALERAIDWALIGGGGLVCAVVMINVMFNVLHMNRYVANLIAIGVVTAWNFWVNSKVSWSGTGASR